MKNSPIKLNKKNLIIALAVIWALISLFAIIFVLYTSGKVSITVKYAPFAAVVKLDDTVIMNNNNNYITPGSYHLTVEYENFQTFESDITINEDSKYIYGKLVPTNQDGATYMNDHNRDFLEVEGIAGQIAVEEGIKQREQYPIIEQLPIKDPYFNIGYNIGDTGILNVTVDSSISYRQLAVNKLLEIMSPEDFDKYDVVFYNLDNPYQGKFIKNSETDPAKYLKTGFADIGIDFTVENGTIDGDYYYAYLRYHYKDFINVIYRVVLTQNATGWQLVSDPYPLLTTTNAPDVPLEIINKVNKL